MCESLSFGFNSFSEGVMFASLLSARESVHPLVCNTTPPGRDRDCSSEASLWSVCGVCICACVRVHVYEYVGSVSLYL